ncbi:DUF833-domain-containing protein [Violaceomyces palustris]|uniref:DUF833-domain-containing protein n=1 Tax=Violaceomyces palustris TaxID=1673888 RepID=A0ACD0P909_9BASI|nr:DUF833-domain-containing protein [Violaceomyces palustris]
MCILFWSTDHPTYSFICASNRDEFLKRPTLKAGWHDFSKLEGGGGGGGGGDSGVGDDNGNHSPSSILSGRDSDPNGGGTWLGVNRNGLFGALLNFTEDPPSPPQGLDRFRSRGDLVREWLTFSSGKPKDVELDTKVEAAGEEEAVGLERYLQDLRDRLDHYPGFNLLLGDLSTDPVRVGYLTNRTPQGCLARANQPHYPPSIHVGGLSNSVLQQPWSKVEQGKCSFREALSEWDLERRSEGGEAEETKVEDESLAEKLFKVLWTSSDPPPKDKTNLRGSVLISPVGGAHVPGGWYATRTSTVILVRRKDRKATFFERDVFGLGVDGNPVKLFHNDESLNRRQERRFEWTLEQPR